MSAPHRAFVANVLGQLAVAPNPDPAAIARQLDSILAPNERAAILRVNASSLAQEQTIAETMQSQIQSQMTSEQRTAMQQQFAKMKADLQHLTPEQRSAMERQAAQFRTMAPPAPLGAYGTQMEQAQDAGSVLLRTLTTPATAPSFHFSARLNPAGV